MSKLPFYHPHGNEVALFEHAWRNRLPLLIKGPTGCGKTRFVAHMAANCFAEFDAAFGAPFWKALRH